jgi:hypothetical protein
MHAHTPPFIYTHKNHMNVSTGKPSYIPRLKIPYPQDYNIYISQSVKIILTGIAPMGHGAGAWIHR